MKTYSMLLLFSLLLLAYAPARAYQTPQAGPPQSNAAPRDASASQTPDRVLGEVRAFDLASKKMSVRVDQAGIVSVVLQDSTLYYRVPPGEKSLEKAEKIPASDIHVGDRVFARGSFSQPDKAVVARQVIMMAKADIVEKQDRERAEWVKRGITGVISAVNPEKREITVQVRTAEGTRPLIIVGREGSRLRRYAPGSVKFTDAKPSDFAELKVGDQIRALGDKSHDGKRYVAEDLVAGAFRTTGGTVLEVIPQRREVKISQISNKQELTILITRDTMIRRITPQMATAILQATEGGADKKGAKAPVDLQAMLEKTPPMPPQEIRPGDVIIVASTQGADPSRVTAISYLSGLDVLLNVFQGKKPPSDSAGLRNVDTGLPLGVLEFGIGLP